MIYILFISLYIYHLYYYMLLFIFEEILLLNIYFLGKQNNPHM